jgi:hypothetical protein
MRILICAVLMMSMLLAAPAVMAEPDDAPVGMKILDFMLVRPVGFVVSLASTGVYLATVPLTFPMGYSYDLGTYMVTVPWRYTSSREYGNFSDYRDNRTIRGRLIADAK